MKLNLRLHTHRFYAKANETKQGNPRKSSALSSPFLFIRPQKRRFHDRLSGSVCAGIFCFIGVTSCNCKDVEAMELNVSVEKNGF
ncbi:hypothetical protein MRB53_036167 [Persea americana]|uniref:Uncharacterized protein n=1 Tax=Persea americana TaxID=3435 RepID=A0ACC2K6M9_PERAE|nr:hypothetical protein MRB53_036167 [Persea americana]